MQDLQRVVEGPGQVQSGSETVKKVGDDEDKYLQYLQNQVFIETF